jgi:LPXTG-motif cell wall-anchored protein
MPLTRRSVPLLATAAFLLWPVTAWAADPTLSPTPPPGLLQGRGHNPHPKPKPKPSHRHRARRPAQRPRGALPQTGTDLALEAVAAGALLAGGSLLRATRYFGRQ